MKAVIAFAIVALAATTCFAADTEKKAPSPAQQAQPAKMKRCNADAGEKSLKGDERKQFMSECLGAKAAPPTQQDKMKTCNAEAGSKALKGDERKKFLSECLKAK